jgi:GNAT superfamily N-acetyltransferase
VTTNSQLVTVANENFVASYVKLVEHCTGSEARRIGGIFAFATGLPISLFNGCVVVEPSAPTDLDDAIDWVAAHLVPYRVFVSPGLAAELAPVPAAHGLQRDPLPYPGMVLHPIPEPPEPAAGVAVTPVDASGREDFLAVGEALGLQPDLAESLFPRSLFGDEEVQPFVGRLDGRPVGYSLAIASRRAAGVYNVGTLHAARRRGVGTALTWAAVAAGRKLGLDSAVLQSSEMAVSMYEAMGFRTVTPYVVFRQPDRGQGTFSSRVRSCPPRARPGS